MKRFNILTFLISFFLIGCFLIPSFICAAAEDESTLGNGIIGAAFAKLFYILRFPTHTLLWDLFSSSAMSYFLGLLINTIFWGLVFERTVFLLKKFNRRMQS